MRALFMLLAIVAMAAIPVAAAAQQAAPPAKSAAAKPAKSAKSAKAAGSSTAVVNINTATQAQLESLPGLGAKAAERILEYRQKNGQFKRVEDLMNVKGIGEKSFLKLKPRLTVTEKAAPSGGPDRQV
jgi:competence protein ComEA